jgi:PASTA domain-containing protein
MNLMALLLAPKFAQQYGDTRSQAWRAALPALVVNNPALSLALTSVMARRFAEGDVKPPAATAPGAIETAPVITPPPPALVREIQELLSEAGVPQVSFNFVPPFVGIGLDQARQIAAATGLDLVITGNPDGLVLMQSPLPGTELEDDMPQIQLRLG